MQHDLVCFSHLRWDFVYQRPQHLLSRFARHRRVFFFEEPVRGDAFDVRLGRRDGNVTVVTPVVPEGTSPRRELKHQREILDTTLAEHGIEAFVSWYYTPMALRFSNHLKPLATVFDCMDELSLFEFAPPELVELESQLFRRADVVFTGGVSLFEAKRHRHNNIHCFPSSVDLQHFSKARRPGAEPPDQAAIPHPRLGFAGVVDERMDLPLLAALAAARPELQLVIVGPVVKIDERNLPRANNIHYLGSKPYAELPAYLRGWDVGLLPFAMNRSTRFISPTKTPEYLAAGLPVVSTPIRDVVRPYGEKGLVHIADSAEAFCAAVDRALAQDVDSHLRSADRLLSESSWDTTWARMDECVNRALEAKNARTPVTVAGRTQLAPALQTMRVDS